MIHFDKIILVGDFNLHMDDASNYSATEFLKLQKHLILCNSNFVHMSDHKCNMNKLVLVLKSLNAVGSAANTETVSCSFQSNTEHQNETADV